MVVSNADIEIIFQNTGSFIGICVKSIRPALLYWLSLSNKSFNPIRPGLFSRSLGPGGGSEAQMPKIEVNINQLKWNLAWVIMAIKAFLMQNLSLTALLVLEIWRHKISLGRRERVTKFGYLPPENGFNFKKNEFLCPESFFSTQNWPPPHVNFSKFQA